ncbi:MAG: preprotein translocase subunit YajC [Verrucomicrobiota bacterium]
MNLLTSLIPLAQDAPPPGGGLDMILIPVLMLVGFYFLLIAPQRKKQKEHEKKIGELKSGDKIVTNGGLYATVINVKDDRLIIRLGEDTKVELAKQFVATINPSEGGAAGNKAK